MNYKNTEKHTYSSYRVAVVLKLNTYSLTSDWILCGDGQLFDGAAAEGVAFTLGRKQPQLFLLLLSEAVAISEKNINLFSKI